MGYRYNVFTGQLDFVQDGNGSSDFASQFVTDSGTAVPAANIINFLGDSGQGISSTGSGNTVTYTIADATESQKGVAELATDAEAIAGANTTNTIVPSSLTAKLGNQTANAIPYGQGAASAIAWSSALTDGQLMIGATGMAPAAANLISSDASITITNGANSIDLTFGGAVASSFITNSGTAVPSGGELQVLGDTEFITTSGASNIVTADITANFEETGMHGWNGALLETADISIASDGATITLSVEQSGGGDLTAVFSDGYYDWDTTPADTVTLTAGTDTAPQFNYTYFLQSTKALTNSTSGWPAAEHVPIATSICQSASSLQTDGPYKQQNWTDHVVGSDEQGHLSHLNFWIRQQNATWVEGVSQTYTITTNGASPDNVFISTASGVVLQLHENAFPAFANADDYYVVNDNATPFTIVNDLNALLTDSTGASMSGRYFSLVLWGSVNSNGESKRFINLPSGSYNNQTNLEEDISGFANYTIPSDFKSTGFLISEWKLRHQATSGGTWTSIEEDDLRGFIPGITAGGTITSPTEFADTLFRIFDDGDSTKEIAFQASGITTATTRTITMADYDIDLDSACISAPTDSGTATPSSGALTIAGGIGCSTSGSGSTVTINTAGGGLDWNVETGTSANMAVNNAYIGNNAAGVTFTLPDTAAVGDMVRVTGLQASWTIAQNAGETIYFGNDSTTTGAGGSLASTNARDVVELVCVVADTDWQVLSSIGNITVT